jgi:hypothetical protein
LRQEKDTDEMELLVERLISQLEHEKKIKQRMDHEIKRLNKELVIYEKEIMDKNNKIYILELNAIRSGKSMRVSKSTNNLESRYSNNQKV